MCSVKQRYRDISPVTLQVVGGDMSSSLYCAVVEGLAATAAGLVESFLVELYRCKLCQFTCGLKSSISTHLQQRHRPPALTYLSGGGADAQEEEVGLRQTEDDEDFLLYNMLDNMSPPTCDISAEAGLQVAHTCEVSTLFEEEEEEEECSIFPLEAGSVDLPHPPSTQEEMAQSAHLRTLGLCRISINKSPSIASVSMPRPPPTDHPPHPLISDSGSVRRRSLSCVLCPVMLSSRRMLDVHVRSHRAGGGFSCVCCDWTAASWEELQPHWRSHSRGRSHSGRKELKKQKVSQDRNREAPGSRLIGPAATKEAELHSSAPQRKEQRRRTHTKEGGGATGFSCSLCHRTFSSKLTLRRHLGVHGGEKVHSCPHCSYSSRLKGSLQQHLRTHTGERPYRCTQCAYASIDRSSLLRHCRTHSQEKPHTCPHCDYSSIQKKSLDLHRRRHHTGEAFPCQQCQYSSPDRQLLLRHIRKHHSHSQHASGQQKTSS
ncbi:zinc finger protein 664-like [Sphaeramia orbicularis]|uniref:Zinc finger protein 664-like n=1 Tax=Sphaeramia orbicularis TaxID=375764 RepID=A0A673AL28_9TELE|nr:zinc finger protein 664-like [Sphaeramia orbicularis]XP_030016271.1 zinc finger protein 664-like [Sphaeramia orbicularis]